MGNVPVVASRHAKACTGRWKRLSNLRGGSYIIALASFIMMPLPAIVSEPLARASILVAAGLLALAAYGLWRAAGSAADWRAQHNELAETFARDVNARRELDQRLTQANADLDLLKRGFEATSPAVVLTSSGSVLYSHPGVDVNALLADVAINGQAKTARWQFDGSSYDVQSTPLSDSNGRLIGTALALCA